MPGRYSNSIILETEHWLASHRADSVLPGYLILGARQATNELHRLPERVLAELGGLLAKLQRALQATLDPEHLYVGRYGHTSGHAFHFHIIPICGWVKQCFFEDPRYRALLSLQHPPVGDTDGAELTLYVWREFCERPDPPPISGPSVEDVVEMLRSCLASSRDHDAEWRGRERAAQ
jgi:diadenosine tetraphosphate (Ap4A) HIT family hydrolase